MADRDIENLADALAHCVDCGVGYRAGGLYADGRCSECHDFYEESDQQ